jgi:hypothetical protein
LGKLNSYDNIKTICGSWHINLSGFAAERTKKKEEGRRKEEEGRSENQSPHGLQQSIHSLVPPAELILLPADDFLHC